MPSTLAGIGVDPDMCTSLAGLGGFGTGGLMETSAAGWLFTTWGFKGVPGGSCTGTGTLGKPACPEAGGRPMTATLLAFLPADAGSAAVLAGVGCTGWAWPFGFAGPKAVGSSRFIGTGEAPLGVLGLRV